MFCAARSKQQLLSSSQEFKPSPNHDRSISHRASPEKEAEEMENHYEEEPVPKFPVSVFETEEDIHQSNHSRSSQPHNRKQGKLMCTLGNSRQEVLYSSNGTWEENKCPNGGWATLYISTGLKGTWTKVSITVCNPMGSLGLSIAGGKGSTPYKINDEGIFISKVSKGGAADLAGLRVGDMVLEVNGISLQNVTHHEAVRALRSSGTVIKILILRNRAVTTDTTEVPTLRSSDTYTSPPEWNEWPNAEALTPEDVFPERRTCNGRNLGSVTSMNRSVNSADRTSQKRDSFRAVNYSMPNPLLKEKKGQCSVMKSMVRINETAKPLAFTFVPTVRRLPAHIQVMDTRFSHQPGKLQSSVASSSILNEPLYIAEEEQSGSFRVEDGIVEGASNRSWLNNEGKFGPAEEASQIQGIFKAEFVLLTDSDGSDSDCFSQGDGVDLSATAVPLSSLTPNPFADDKGSFVHPNVVEDKTKVPFLRDAEQKLDGDEQESLFQYKIKSSYKAFAAIPTNTLLLDQKAIDEAVSDLGETTTQSTSKEIHSQFLYEPGSLRQQSEELYATIEQVLEDPLPSRCTSSSLRSPAKLLDSEAHKSISPIPKSAGRETKYANLHLPSPETTENQPTRPGVIRPITALQKGPAMLEVDGICSNPFRQHTNETNNSEIKECLFPLSAILASVPHPSVCYEMYQTMPCSQDMPQSVPLSLSPVTCLTSGSHIRFSPIAPCNYYMTSNLSRSLHSLYIKPRHSITTIHENEALGSTELPNATEKPNKGLLQRPGTEIGSGKLMMDYGGRGQGAQEILEEGKQRAVK
ncbi:uncharacterized protein mlip isoform X5 [Mobula birostris]|uniref:uncharacterized protein mlip isoform X5 n=1 Tax=Mobula birostris TaxID=1983395 RepID=UPI003B286F16